MKTKTKAKTKAVKDSIRWHIEGTLDGVAEGEIVEILEWPISGGVRAYVVSRDHPTIKVSIVPIDWVVEEK